MSWIDVFTAYLYLLKMVAIGVAVVIFISSLDDLFIDIAYWVRRVWRAFTVYARHAPLNYRRSTTPRRSRWPSWCPPGRSTA